jgi:ABC-type sulfate transport system permease component
MSVDSLVSLGIGLLVMCAVYVGLRRAFGGKDSTVRRAIAVFSAVAGIVVTLFLREHPDLLEQQGTKIVLALIGVVLAFIAASRRNVE